MICFCPCLCTSPYCKLSSSLSSHNAEQTSLCAANPGIYVCQACQSLSRNHCLQASALYPSKPSLLVDEASSLHPFLVLLPWMLPRQQTSYAVLAGSPIMPRAIAIVVAVLTFVTLVASEFTQSCPTGTNCNFCEILTDSFTCYSCKNFTYLHVGSCHANCRAFTGFVERGSGELNRLCVGRCRNSEYDSTPAAATATCRAISTCTAGFVEASPPTVTSNRVCVPIKQECAADEYETSAATATTPAQCMNVSQCETNQFQVAVPTKTSDRRCQAHRDCPFACRNSKREVDQGSCSCSADCQSCIVSGDQSVRRPRHSVMSIAGGGCNHTGMHASSPFFGRSMALPDLVCLGLHRLRCL